MRQVFVLLSVAASSSACSGLFRPVLTSIETTQTAGGQSTVETWRFVHEGDEVRSVDIVRDNALQTSVAVTYADGKVSRVVLTPAQGTGTTEHTLAYDGEDRLQTLTVVETSTGTARTESSTYVYDNASRLSSVTLVEDNTSIVTHYRYDAEGRLEEVRNDNNGIVSTRALRFDEDDRLDSLTRTLTSTVGGAAGSSATSYNFSHNDDGKLERLDVSSASGSAESYEALYDDEGRINEVRYTTGPVTRSTRYTYGEGSVAGVLHTPQLVWGDMFDLEGTSLTVPEVLTLTLFE